MIVESIEILEGDYYIESISCGEKSDIECDGDYFTIKNNLKSDYPDIDFDTSDPMILKQVLIDKWGKDCVVPITNWNTLQLRSLIKDLSKLYGVPYQEVNEVTSVMSKEATSAAKEKHGMTAGMYIPTYEEHMEFSESLKAFMEKYPDVGTNIKALQGQIRSCSRHAGGIIVSENISHYMPLINSGGVIQTPWSEGQNVRHLEPLGFIKFDILGLATLRVIENCISRILVSQGNVSPSFSEIREFYDKNIHPSIINFNDQKVYEHVFHEGRWLSVFQFTEKQAQDFCKKVKPINIIDLSAVTSIYRPGPLCISGDSDILAYASVNSGKGCSRYKKMKDLFKEFKNKNSKSNFYLSSLDEKTNGIIKNKIQNVFESGEKEVFEIELQYFHDSNRSYQHTNKKIVKGSADHKFLTSDGWKALKDINPGDYICYYNNNNAGIRVSSSTKNIVGQKNFRNICYYNFKYECLFCDWKEGSLDVNHIEGSRKTNNSPDNLCFLCPNHHRLFSEGKISKEKILEAREPKRLPFSKDIRYLRVISLKSSGLEKTYDIEMTGPHHNFFAGDLVVHNSAHVDVNYVKAKENPENIKYIHPVVKEITEETCGFLIFQEQIALIAHKLGKDLSLDEGNMLRKVLTKKGTGKGHEVKDGIYIKFIAGCLEKNIDKAEAEKLWQTFEFFSGYGFNKSHAVCYSILSYQCAWLLTYHSTEWIASYLDEETQDDSGKAKAISTIKSLGYKIEPPHINNSGDKWRASSNGQTFYQPLSSIKGLGEKAIEQIVNNRPFNTIEELVLSEKIVYSKLNKKGLDVLARCGAVDFLMDNRFSGKKHFWMSFCGERPKTKKKFDEYISLYKELGDFTKEEIIDNSNQLLGFFPLEMVMSQQLYKRLEDGNVPPISKFDEKLGVCWFIPNNFETKISKNNKAYYVVQALDDSGKMTEIKCWSIDIKKDIIYLNRPYVAKLTYDESFGGFSCIGTYKNWKMIG